MLQFLVQRIIFLYITLTLCNTVISQELTIYVLPSQHEINWSSPKHLLMSYYKNTYYKNPYGKYNHPIGHVMVELKDSTRFALVGTSASKDAKMTPKVLLHGYGLGILFAEIKGRMDEADVNLPEVKNRSKDGVIAFIRYNIHPSVFNRLWQYLKEYKEKGYDKIYNGTNKPLEGGGAGCSAFAMSFLEVGGLKELLPEEKWIVQEHIPENLIGGPPSNGRKVSLVKLMTHNSWAKEFDPKHRDIFFYEPTFMYNWINRKWDGDFTEKNVTKVKLNEAKGFEVNCTDIIAPSTPIWMDQNKALVK